MMFRQRLLDLWGRSHHTHRRNVIEAALLKAGERGMTNDELFEKTEFSHGHVRIAIRKLKREGRVKEMDGRYYWISGAKEK
jgi:DNA-binding transcriptional regulator GbsR (MarR family)